MPRMRRIVAVGAPLLVVLGAGVAFLLWRAEVAGLRRQWAARLAVYRAAGEPTGDEAWRLPVAPPEENAAPLEDAATWETLRAAPPTPPDEDRAHRGAFVFIPGVLERKPFQTLAVLRLARWALVLDRVRREGGPLSTDPCVYASFFPDGLPLDPYTDRPFPLTLAHGVLTIEPDVGAAPPRLDPGVEPGAWEAEGLRWSFDVGR